jgi:hypothetical protein
MFQNPMMLVMVFGGVMMLAMPYVMVGHISFFYSLRFAELTQSMIPHAEKHGPGTIARSAAEPATA